MGLVGGAAPKKRASDYMSDRGQSYEESEPQAYNQFQSARRVPEQKKYIYNPLTYSSEFFIPVQINDEISKKIYLRWLLLVDLVIQTKRGHFIVNGYPKTVIHQIIRSPGIRFKNEENQILADIISVRGAWMGIQIQYEKNTSNRQFKMGGGSDGKSQTFSMFGSYPTAFRTLEIKATLRNLPSYLSFKRTFDTKKINNTNFLRAFSRHEKHDEIRNKLRVPKKKKKRSEFTRQPNPEQVPKKRKKSYSMISQFLFLNSLKISIYKSFLAEISNPIIYEFSSRNLFVNEKHSINKMPFYH